MSLWRVFTPSKKVKGMTNALIALLLFLGKPACQEGKRDRAYKTDLVQLAAFSIHFRMQAKFCMWVFAVCWIISPYKKTFYCKNSLWLEFFDLKHFLPIKCYHIPRVRDILVSLLIALIVNTDVRFLLWLTFVNSITGLTFPLHSTFYFHDSLWPFPFPGQQGM